MCVDCDDKRIARRSFLYGATTALAGAMLSSNALGQDSPRKLIDNTAILKEDVSYKNGSANIQAYLARPSKIGRYPAVVIAHGNPGVPDDIKYTAEYLAQSGFVGLVYDWASSAPAPTDKQELAKWQDYIYTNEFVQRQIEDVKSGIVYLKEQPFVKRRKQVAMVGFCAGGRLALLLAAQSKAVEAVVSFYGPVDYRGRKHKTDPAPDVLEVVNKIRVPVQGHYGLRDEVALAVDAKSFEKYMREQKTPAEMYYYQNAGHSFCNFLRPAGSDPGYDYVPDAANLAHIRMVQFLKRYLT